MNILIAEDNEINQKVLKAIFEKNKYQYEIASDGLQAYNLMKQKNFDLILMDCQMPILDGFQATKMIRETELKINKSRCPIVAITANAMSGDKEKCLEAGMDDFLAKPFKSQDILKIIEKWSNQKE